MEVYVTIWVSFLSMFHLYTFFTWNMFRSARRGHRSWACENDFLIKAVEGYNIRSVIELTFISLEGHLG